MLENGTIIDDKYKILNKIGQGGMSIVYLAMNEKANKQWAIKEVRKDVTKDFEVIRQGLITETNLLKNLSHPNLPSIIDVIEREDTFLIVMDYIEGVPLSVRLQEQGAQPQEDVVEWALQLCDVLQYLHTREKPIIYRDMKPANVMLKPNGDLVLIDFGIAREYKTHHTSDTTWLGTQGYAAPEQFGGQGQTDQRTDIYCLGATLYHLLTNHNPSDPPYEMYPIRRWNEELSSGLEEIIIKCTQRNPKDRYQNCNELRYALERYQEMDVEYRRMENKSFRIFMALLGATVLMLTGTLVFRHYAQQTRDNDYKTCVENALATSNYDEAMELFTKAIKLDPSSEEAYLAMLDYCMEDDNLSEKEAYHIREMLQLRKGKNTYEDLLKENQAGYDAFSYQMGMAYYYSYEENGNKNNAKRWLQTAAQSQYLEPFKVERSNRLQQIAEYYSKIGVQSKSGDQSTSYKDFWKDLVEVTQGDIVHTDNPVTALVMYNEFTFQIAANAQKFQRAGVSETEMAEQINVMIDHLNNDFVKEDLENERVNYLWKKLINNVRVAERELETNFSIPKEKGE
ncbi:MAG: serine/threonine protein kinase [Lachnospiraceae bacterium]|nr:serine/threonine protein kinase [Lachnospiraceae bacterium]